MSFSLLPCCSYNEHEQPEVRARLSQGDQRVEAEHSANVGVHVTNAVGFNMIRHWNFYLSFHLTSCTKCEVTRSKTAAG